ncbi:hypothetical protein ABZ656_04395 [Streptomyces sp. NPDC007095]|jgi:hypothetical protein|uniref:hypothetical protein n=1 Tax=Streptomyces sp. NPDC007095 TaxID=3154482 RepID=UPI003406E8AC
MTTRTPTGSPATTVAGPARSALLSNPYGLSLREIRAEIRRCAANGWQLWEIRLRFTADRKDRTT